MTYTRIPYTIIIMKTDRMIRSDAETIEKLKRLAGERPLGALLRDIADGKTDIEVPVYHDPLEELRMSLIKQITELKTYIKEELEHHDSMIMSAIQGMVNEQDNNDLLFETPSHD